MASEIILSASFLKAFALAFVVVTLPSLINCVVKPLKRAQVNSVSDLMGFSYEDLLEIKNFGSKSADEVIEALERIGISIPQSRTSV